MYMQGFSRVVTVSEVIEFSTSHQLLFGGQVRGYVSGFKEVRAVNRLRSFTDMLPLVMITELMSKGLSFVSGNLTLPLSMINWSAYVHVLLSALCSTHFYNSVFFTITFLAIVVIHTVGV